jgi:hypothetical protein
VEVSRHLPQRTLKLKLACDNRAALRVFIGIAGDKDATAPEHELAPQPLNGWPLFGKRDHVGNFPLAGPDNHTPLELGIDLTPLLDKLGSDADGSRLFLKFRSADNSDTTGKLHACAIRSYDAHGAFVGESVVEFQDGNFGKTPLTIESIIH